jgi:NADPH2:quinone reductase
MRAAVLSAFDTPLELTQLPDPVPGAGWVLVRVHASGVNPLDVKIRRGQAAHAQVVPPAVLGIDMAGVVESVGPDVSDFRVGDEVYGMTGGVGAVQGSLAELAAVDARLLAQKPSTLSMRQAAVVPLAFITAWEGLVDRAEVSAGQTVLVQGGAGGIGHLAIQLARARFALVYASGSDGSQDAIGAI